MGFLEEAKKQGYSKEEATAFADRVTQARKAGYSDDEISSFLDQGSAIPTSKTPIIRAPNSLDQPPAGSIHAPIDTADQTSALLSRGRLSETGREMVKDAPEVLGATAMLAAGGTGVGIPAAMGLAALGGAGGKGYQLAAQELTKSPGAPQTPGQAALEVGAAGARQGIAEGAGRAVLKAIGRVVRGNFFNPTDEVLGGATASTADREANKAAMLAGKKPPVPKEELLKKPNVNADELMRAYGSNYTAAQMTNSRTLDTLDNMAQGSFFGGDIMDKAFHSQQKAVKDMSDSIAGMFVKDSSEKMSDRQIGQLFVDTIQNGKNAFKTASEKMFRNVDDLVYQNMQLANPEEVNPILFPGKTGTTVSTGESIMGAPGMPEVIPTKKPSEAGYVNTKPIAERASQIIQDYKRVSNVGKSDAGGTFLDKVAAVPESMPFGDAQLLRSGLLQEARNLAQEGGQAYRFASELSGLADKQMETAASKLSGDALSAWRDANKFYKFGKTNFDNQFIQKLAQSGKVNWEEVGDLLFRSGNVEEVYQARRALRSAEFASKKAESMTPAELQVVTPTKEAIAKQGKPYALFQGNFEATKQTPAFSTYRMYGEHPRSGGNFPAKDLEAMGIPITGKEARVKEGVVPTDFNPPKPEPTNPVDFQQTWRQMQAGYYDSLLKKNTGVDGTFNPTGVLKDLNNKKTSRTIQAAFNNDQLNAIRNFARAAEIAKQGNPSKTGSMVIQIAQAGPIALAMGNPGEIFGDDQNLFQRAGVGILLTPPLMAKLLTNPMTTRWLIQGIRTPISSGAAGGLTARLGLALVRAAKNSALPAEQDVQP